ncbi:MAG: O-acetyl-ADP-ribose deacetylase [Elusimicrobia bacterium]|nr:O-acetyl-ADP-ribose deacetylase [Elusimicrobiota bacterium]
METVSRSVRNKTIEVAFGDITRQDTEAIVNAANRKLLGGGGVDGAIHRAAGRGLLEECKIQGGCETGDAKLTSGYNLKARFVIHTVGPVYSGSKKDAKLLRKCHYKSLRLASDNKVKTIAIPAISTGVYGYPADEAASIAISSTVDFLKYDDTVKLVRFVLFDKDKYDVFRKELEKQLK